MMESHKKSEKKPSSARKNEQPVQSEKGKKGSTKLTDDALKGVVGGVSSTTSGKKWK
jgi:hypothetical protein